MCILYTLYWDIFRSTFKMFLLEFPVNSLCFPGYQISQANQMLFSDFSLNQLFNIHTLSTLWGESICWCGNLCKLLNKMLTTTN